jgi:hypothetical protein
MLRLGQKYPFDSDDGMHDNALNDGDVLNFFKTPTIPLFIRRNGTSINCW